MDNLEKLQAKLDLLLSRYGKLVAENANLKEENQQLSAAVAELEKEATQVLADQGKMRSKSSEKDKILRRRIASLIKRVDQLQGELKIS
ncbi:MAG: hypothetical protein KAT58_05580 [candidate division Zixibacteria bacterium]|nr:hypothetical protein [candidate division Zixibacteria bacterium]